MDTKAAFSSGSDKIHRDTLQEPSAPSNLKTYAFVLAMIGGLAVGGIGVTGYFQVGSLSHMAQINAIIMMAAGGGGGIIFLIVGIIGTVKNRQTTGRPDVENHPNPLSSRKQGPRQTEFIETASRGLSPGMPSIFGKEMWNKYFGDVGAEPSFPNEMHKLLNSPCPFSGDEQVKIKDTHMLVLIPATVNGEALTLEKLEELVKTPKNGGNPAEYYYYSKTAQNEHGNQAVKQSYWVLMTRDVIPETRNQTYEAQKIQVGQFANEGYAIPHALEAAICIFTDHVYTGNYLFSDTPITYMNCSETTQGKYPVCVGKFTSLGLYVDDGSFVSYGFGMAALRRL